MDHGKERCQTRLEHTRLVEQWQTHSRIEIEDGVPVRACGKQISILPDRSLVLRHMMERHGTSLVLEG